LTTTYGTPIIPDMDIQQLLKDIRSAGLNQQQIAEKTGLSQSYICDLGKGRCGKRIGYEAARKLNELHFKLVSPVPPVSTLEKKAA
jgi:predicted transcriptional regulator